MNAEFLFNAGSSELAKTISWLAAAIIALAGLLFAKQAIGSLLLKLYEYVIQNNQPLL